MRRSTLILCIAVLLTTAIPSLLAAQDLKPAPAGMTADKVLAAYIDALGGAKKLTKIQTLNTDMSFSMQGMSLLISSWQKSPDKLRIDISSGGTVVTSQIYDGKKGFMSSPMGNQEVSGEELNTMKWQAILNIELFYDQYDIKRELEGIATIDGKEAYQLKISFPDGTLATEFFDCKTGLKIRRISKEMTQDVLEYKKVDGIQFPFSYRQGMGTEKITLLVEKVEINKSISDDKFIIP